MPVLTKLQQIESRLRGAILRGDWAPGEQLTAERELVPQLGVSRSTLRHALSVLASEGLVVCKPGSGTFVSDETKTGIVAVVSGIRGFASPLGYWYQALVDEARKRVHEARYRAVHWVGYGDNGDEFLSSIHLLDGAARKDTIGVLSLTDAGGLQELLAEEGIPSVTMEGCIPLDRYSVVLDYPRMLDIVVSMMKTHGHNEFAIMCFGYGDADSDAGIDPMRRAAVGPRDDLIVRVPWTERYEHPYQCFKDWWARPDRPNAIFFEDDAICDVASRAILELGIRVPEELAVMTLAHVGRRFHFPVQFSGVGFDPAQVVAAGWGMLDRLIKHQSVDQPIVRIPPVVRAGESL